MTRELAPISTPETVESLYRNARDKRHMLEYRASAKTRKHGSIDSFSVSMVNQVLDAIKPENKEKLIRMSKGHAGKMALICWNLVGKK